MQEPKLTNRLKAIYKHIVSGGAADIGTDHGYIPVRLALSAYPERLVASDVSSESLDKARQTAVKHNVYDEIDFIHCDGLSDISPINLKNIIIAGMGGETIATILSKAPWTSEDERLLILQPMSKSDLLREWLQQNSYYVLHEELCEDGKIYEIIIATGGNDVPYSPAEKLLGHIHLISSDPLYKRRLRELVEKTEKIAAVLKNSKKPKDSERLKAQLQTLYQLQEL